jgi:hypothetical protein
MKKVSVERVFVCMVTPKVSPRGETDQATTDDPGLPNEQLCRG